MDGAALVIFFVGFYFGWVATLFPVVALLYLHRERQLVLGTVIRDAPSGVQMRRTTGKRKPIVADDRKAWEKENEKP
jgi:hypothetical protein